MTEPGSHNVKNKKYAFKQVIYKWGAANSGTFSTTEVNLKVRYSPVVKDEKRLPYSLFRKKRYQTGVGNKAR